MLYVVKLFFTGGYFFVELIWGLSVGSLALVADAMHMLSDVIALCVGFYAVHVGKRENGGKATFGQSPVPLLKRTSLCLSTRCVLCTFVGWTRMEVVGGLMNGTFLLAICFTIFMEAIHRLTEDESESLEEGAGTLIIVGKIIGLLRASLSTLNADWTDLYR